MRVSTNLESMFGSENKFDHEYYSAVLLEVNLLKQVPVSLLNFFVCWGWIQYGCIYPLFVFFLVAEVVWEVMIYIMWT